jgi:putative spermidine/putrescine transport system substrate-binding protein
MSADLIGRRKFLGVGAGALAAATLGPGQASASGSIAAMSFPGVTEEMTRKCIVPAFRAATGATVNLAPMLAVEAIAKLSASRANPPLDVITLDDPTAQIAVADGLIHPLPLDKVPHAKDIPTKLHAYGGIAQSFQLIGIMYNPRRIPNPPKAWEDLWKPEYKGKVSVIAPDSSLGLAWLVSLAKERGGSEDNLEPAWKAIESLAPNLATVPRNPGSLSALMGQGQIDICVGALSYVMPARARGEAITLAMPSSGYCVVLITAHIVANTPNLDLAAAYINAIADPKVQVASAEAPYYRFPTNSKVPYPADLKVYANSTDELLGLITTDWAKLNPRRREIIDRFNRLVSKA